MTAGKLIEILSKFPDDMPVYHESDCDYVDVESVEKERLVVIGIKNSGFDAVIIH